MSTQFALVYPNHDGDHVEYICEPGVTITRAWEICDQLNTARGYDKLEPYTVEALS